jgi:hypothetical protein
MTPLPPPRWYPNPSGASGQRYFDGRTWTPYHRATSEQPGPTSPPASAPPRVLSVEARTLVLEKRAVGLLDCDDHRHGVVRQPAGNERACDHTSGIGGEMDRVGQNGNVEVVGAVAAWCDVAGSDHKPADQFAWCTFCA